MIFVRLLYIALEIFPVLLLNVTEVPFALRVMVESVSATVALFSPFRVMKPDTIL